MKKHMAVFALFCVLISGVVISSDAVPAWEGMWEKAGAYWQASEEENTEPPAAGSKYFTQKEKKADSGENPGRGKAQESAEKWDKGEGEKPEENLGRREVQESKGNQGGEKLAESEEKTDKGDTEDSEETPGRGEDRKLEKGQAGGEEGEDKEELEERQAGEIQLTAANEKQTAREADLGLYAKAAVLMDSDSGRILYGKNEREVLPMASTTKIMTCILALELGNEEDIVIASDKAASQPQVHLGVSSGRRFYLKDLLYSLMLESHNDSAVMIAEHIGGNTEEFARMMNQKARDIGCTDTWFITPNGLDASSADNMGTERIHSTTAADLARIMKYCISESPAREKFLTVTKTPSYTFSDAEGKRNYSCVNHNAFLNMMEGAFSGKTGFTNGAGYCYVGALEDGERSFIIALLGCGWPPHKTYKWSDAKELFQYGLEHYEYRNVWKDINIPDVPVANAVPEDGDISHKTSVSARVSRVPSSVGRRSLEEKGDSQSEGKAGEDGLYLLLKEEEKPEVLLHMEKELKAPVGRGDVAGWVEYRLEGKTAAVYPVVLTEGAEKLTFSWCMEKAVKAYLCENDR
ncbi:serine hydrolase [Lachnospiraceae bacterium 62-35]